MKQTSRPAGNGANPWEYSIDQDRLALPTVLLVEDDRDIREMMGTLLDMAGFAVVACDNAESGLDALREQLFDLVLTDYELPRQSGLWLLEEAESEGLIQSTPVLIVTAHPNLETESEYEVIQKPLDLDALIERIRQRTEGAAAPRRRRASMRAAPRGSSIGGNDPRCPDPVELILYVSSQSPRSFAAVKSIRKVLERFNASRVKLTVCDLSENPEAGVDDAVAFTPTLVRRKPGARTYILGHITSPEVLLELLADCDAELN